MQTSFPCKYKTPKLGILVKISSTISSSAILLSERSSVDKLGISSKPLKSSTPFAPNSVLKKIKYQYDFFLPKELLNFHFYLNFKFLVTYYQINLNCIVI